MDVLALHSRIRYVLYYNKTNHEVLDTINWKSNTLEFTRSFNYHGIFSTISDDISFIKEDANYISNIYGNGRINEEIKFVIYVLNNDSDVEEIYWSGNLDLSEYIKEGDKVTVKINSNGLLSDLKVRLNEKYEIDRTVALDDRIIPTTNKESVLLHGRRILLLSQDEKPIVEQFVNIVEYDSLSNNYYVGRSDRERLKVGLLNKLVTQSDTDFHAITSEGDNLEYNSSSHTYILKPSAATISKTFFTNTLAFDKTIRVNLRILQNLHLIYGWDSGVHILCRLYKYDNGVTLDNETLIHEYSHQVLTTSNDITIDINEYIDVLLNPNQSLSLVYEMYFECDCSTTALSHTIQSTTEIYNISVEWDSLFDASYTKGIRLHEVGKKLTSIIGDYEFKSNLLGYNDIGYDNNGKGSDLVVTHGMYIRNFDDTYSDFKPFITSLDEYIKSLDTVLNIGLCIENNGTKEVLRIENKDYFYQDEVVIKLGKVNNIKRTVAKEFFNSSIEIGYSAPSTDKLYEEALGLDEYNTRTNYSTIINRLKNKKSLISKYRADSYGIEFARRKSFLTNPTDDTRYDKSIFFLDTKKPFSTADYLVLRKYNDDFTELPTGVHSPETAFNLRLTQASLIREHAAFIKAGLIGYPDSKLKYTSSVGNSNLCTVNDVEVVCENEDIPLSILNRNKHKAEWVEFDKMINADLLKQLNGKTNNIPNLYYTIEYINEFNKIEYGYVWSFKLNNNNFKILKR